MSEITRRKLNKKKCLPNTGNKILLYMETHINTGVFILLNYQSNINK